MPTPNTMDRDIAISYEDAKKMKISSELTAIVRKRFEKMGASKEYLRRLLKEWRGGKLVEEIYFSPDEIAEANSKGERKR